MGCDELPKPSLLLFLSPLQKLYSKNIGYNLLHGFVCKDLTKLNVKNIRKSVAMATAYSETLG